MQHRRETHTSGSTLTGEIQPVKPTQRYAITSTKHAFLETEKGGEKRMRRELLNQALMYAIVSLFVLLAIPVMRALA